MCDQSCKQIIKCSYWAN